MANGLDFLQSAPNKQSREDGLHTMDSSAVTLSFLLSLRLAKGGIITTIITPHQLVRGFDGGKLISLIT